MAEAAPDGTYPLWGCRAVDADGRVVWSALVQSTRHADGTAVELVEPDATEAVADAAIAVARHDARGQVVGLSLTVESAPKAPPLWFAEITEPHDTPPATNLLAFSGHGIEAGSLLDSTALRDVAVSSDDQLGAFRWYPSSGFGDQLYVAPAWRRRTIGTGLLAAGGTLAFARDWARLWGDGQRTADGDRMRNASRWQHISQPLTHLMPPMTPPDAR